MRQITFSWINGSLLIAVSLFGLLAFLSYSFMRVDLKQPPVIKQARVYPKSSFELPRTSYEQIQAPTIDLQYSEPNISLPDLRNILQYFGTNRRPDASISNQVLYFSIGDSKDIFPVKNNEPVYLAKNPQTQAYQISSKTEDLWFIARPSGKSAIVTVQAKGVDSSTVNEPRERSSFILSEKPIPLQISPTWYIGDYKVDGTLLLRQRAKWYGEDLFLTLYGGQDLQGLQGKQKIQFGEGEETYPLFISAGDLFIWKDNRWMKSNEEEKTENYPLFEVKKVDERLINFELWDVAGKRKLTLNLIKSIDPIPKVNLENSFQFLGARTKVHYMFNVDGKREIVAPEDWFIFLDNKWQKIKKAKEVDQIANNELFAPLIIFDRIHEQGSIKVLSGKLFNASKSSSVDIEINLSSTPKQKQEEAEVPQEDLGS